jgi:hypothetical protein
MLLVMEEGIKVVLGVAAPSCLVLKSDTLLWALIVICQPNRYGLYILIM